METRDETFGKRLATHRVQKQTSQQDFAHAMRLQGHKWTQQTVAAVETGERQLKLAEAADAAAMLGTTLDALTAGTPEQAMTWLRLAQYQASVENAREHAARAQLGLQKLVDAADAADTEGSAAIDWAAPHTPLAIAGDIVERAEEWARAQDPKTVLPLATSERRLAPNSTR